MKPQITQVLIDKRLIIILCVFSIFVVNIAKGGE